MPSDFADFFFCSLLGFSWYHDTLLFPKLWWLISPFCLIYLFVLSLTYPLSWSIKFILLNLFYMIHLLSCHFPEGYKYLYLILPRLLESIHLWNLKEGTDKGCIHIFYKQTGCNWKSQNIISSYSRSSGVRFSLVAQW